MATITQVWLVAAAITCAASAEANAQTLGPPIPPDQVLRQQNQPVTPVPSPPVPASPGGSPPRTAVPPPVPGGAAADRAARCQHQATVDRVPQSERAAYIHACMTN